MSVTDLSGTRWYFNDTINFNELTINYKYNINFYLYDVSSSYTDPLFFTGMKAVSSSIMTWYADSGSFSFGTTMVSTPNYRHIHILNGEDINNVDLIAWLELNAIQQEFESEDYLTNTYDLTQVANAVRGVTKNNILMSYPSGITNALNNMDDFWTIEQLMKGDSLGSIYYSGSNTYIPDGTFAFKNITAVECPNIISIGASAFQSCKSLITATFSNCTDISNAAFSYCSSLTTISFPKCNIIRSSAFTYCRSLTEAIFPSCTDIYTSAFNACYSLTTISFPECINISAGAFQYCSSLTTVNFPKCTSVSGYAFGYCSSLATASFPKCEYIGSYVFRGCYYLMSFYITEVSQVPSLPYSTTFSSTPIGGYSASTGQYGSIYVPASLYDAFKSATNWTYFSLRMVSV